MLTIALEAFAVEFFLRGSQGQCGAGGLFVSPTAVGKKLVRWRKVLVLISDVSFVNDSFILNESLQGLESNESFQKKIRSFSRGHPLGLA